MWVWLPGRLGQREVVDKKNNLSLTRVRTRLGFSKIRRCKKARQDNYFTSILKILHIKDKRNC